MYSNKLIEEIKQSALSKFEDIDVNNNGYLASKEEVQHLVQHIIQAIKSSNIMDKVVSALLKHNIIKDTMSDTKYCEIFSDMLISGPDKALITYSDVTNFVLFLDYLGES